MGGVYKVRYKKGDLEIEVESHDHSYVNMMIEKLKAGSTNLKTRF
jgi:hypothetical protein